MKCFVCGSEMRDYFKKAMEAETSEWNYVRCEHCGLVLCQTVYDMPSDEWQMLNDRWEGGYQGRDENPDCDPNWLSRMYRQARLFADVTASGLWEADAHIVDYGCGDGKLEDYMQHELSGSEGARTSAKEVCVPKILKYDKYMRPEGSGDYLEDEDVKPGTFDAVVCSAVFEHLRGRSNVEEIIGLLTDRGTFCLHTMVCEEVPLDPDWFYLLPVHCTMWTNKSMGIIYEQYGFVGCAYHVEGRMWFFFRNRQRYELLRSKSPSIPGTWFFSDKFVDYWKQKPYH